MRKFCVLFLLVFSLCAWASRVTYSHKETPYGLWVNLWNYPVNLSSFFDNLRETGINTLYLQTGRSNTAALKRPREIKRILKEAEEKNIKVVGWFYANLENPEEDARKFIAGARLEGLSGMAVDLEENLSEAKLKAFTHSVRAELGSDYSIMAITYSPILRPIKSQFPWKTFAEEFEVLAPMIYWHNRSHHPRNIYHETSQSLADLKTLIENTEGRAKAIHPIGDSHETSSKEVKIFLKACKDQGLIESGVSLYPAHLASGEVLKVFGSIGSGSLPKPGAEVPD